MNFAIFKTVVAKQFEKLSKLDLFRTSITKDALWATYLSSFPAGSNPIYKTNTEHDCNCCKSFIRAIGDVVAIIDGKLVSLWDLQVNDPNYQAVADAMAAAVKAQPIEDIFLHYERTAGTEKTLQDTLDGVKTWNHFFVNIPAKHVRANADIATELSKERSSHDVFLRGLSELSLGALNTVNELIGQNSLYRGEEHKFTVQAFTVLKLKFDALTPEQRTLFTWGNLSTTQPSVLRLRNSAIGTLVRDLSEGVELDKAVSAFEAIVAPANYKRPTALVTKAMIERAKTKIVELGLTSALERRYATINDITINNVLFADRSARKAMASDGLGAFDALSAAAPVNPKAMAKVEEVPIEKFLSDILPSASTLEVMIENQHAGNFVSLIAPADPTAQPLFKWDNNFSWSYTGDVTDSVKERVKKAGGNVTGDLCCRLAWDYTDDLDFHMVEPGGHTIYFGNRHSLSPNGGRLDVDANGGSGMMDKPVENIFYASKSKMRPGSYNLFVHNYTRHSNGAGFDIEVEANGVLQRFNYSQVLGQGKKIPVAQITLKNGVFTVQSDLPAGATTCTIWGLPTMTFRKVNAVMLSPNHWNGHGVGNKHYFFMLDACRNEGQARGFYNEFLKPSLDEHRKVIEMVGAKMKTEAGGDQLSGLGFSSTQRNSLLCKVTGAFTRTVKILF